VEPGETAQFLLAEGLDTETQSIDSGGTERGQPRLGDCLGIRLERDLAVRGYIERCLAGRDNPASSASSSDGVPPPK
jgi:hypothetical protein